MDNERASQSEGPCGHQGSESGRSKFRKHQFVTYEVRGRTISAIVRAVHRDGTVTVEARHELDQSGNIRGCYLGYRYRYEANDLTAEAA